MKNLIALIIINFLTLPLVFPQSQCFEPDAKIWLDSWASCEKSLNPKAEYGQTHWIQYDLGTIRKLSKTWVWNTNDPGKLNQGFKKIKVDYSVDGQNWEYWGEMEFPKAEGKAVYGGFSGPDLMNIEAQYILLTAISNHGHPSCYGFAEIKFNLLPEINLDSIPNQGNEECEAVEEVYLEELTDTEALLFWDYELGPEGNTFIFAYRQAGTEDWTTIETEDYEVFLENLQPATQYEYGIIVLCEDEYYESEIWTFTTFAEGQGCEEVEGIRVSELSESEALLNWNQIEVADNYFVVYGLVDQEERLEVETENPNILLTQLQASSEYEVEIGYECAQLESWSEPFYFTTALATSINDLQTNQDELKVFPNPSTGQVNVEYFSQNSGVLYYTIRNIYGEVLQQNTIQISADRNLFLVDISALPDGLYLLDTRKGNGRSSISRKIVKMQ